MACACDSDNESPVTSTDVRAVQVIAGAHCTMRLLFATHRGHIPERTGGGQQSIHALLRLLMDRGYVCEAVVGLQSGPRLHVMRLIRQLSRRPCCAWTDRRNGYATFRTPEPLVQPFVRARFSTARPDVVVADFAHTNEVAEDAVGQGIPTLLRVISIGCVERRVAIPRHKLLLTYANSAFVAERLRAVYGIEAPVIYPIVIHNQYRAIRRTPDFVTFVNPIEIKGVRVAVEIARRLSARRFLFVEGIPLNGPDRARLGARIAELGNVTFVGPQRDMRSVYARTSVLMVPSQWEEPFGRVVLEAQVNGIPVIAHDIGGLPESVGVGGILIPRGAPAAEWADAIDAVLSSPARVSSLSAAALANVHRPEFEPDRLVDRFLRLVDRVRAPGEIIGHAGSGDETH
jgi:glycosyltransferase involved in cell wall biosynthesis